MATNETEGDQPNANEPHSPATPAPVAQPLIAEPAPSPIPPPAAIPATAVASAQADALRAEYADLAALAAQAARLGVTVDAADAMRKGISADDLRRSVLDALAARSEAATIIAAAPSTPVAGDSPIVRRAKQRAAAASV
jgi:hypothetical protein